MHKDCIIHDVEQGSDMWHQARTGVLTASEFKLILTPKLKLADNEKTRQHVYEIAAQIINNYTEPSYIGDAMLRGYADEIKARDAYSDNYDPVEEVGFITRKVNGNVLGYSPDGIGVLGNFGIECKSRIQKYQIQTITDDTVPDEHIIQVQAGIYIAGLDYIDYCSYSGGMPMWVIRSEPRADYQDAIAESADKFYEQVRGKIEEYGNKLASAKVVIETEREMSQTEVYVG